MNNNCQDGLVSSIGSKIDFKGDFIFNFIIILKFIFTSIFEIKIHKKKFLDTKKIHFRRPTAWELIKNKGSDFGFWRTKENFFNLNQFVDVGDKFSRLASPKWLLKLFYIEHEWLRHIFINKIYNFILMMILIRKVIS